MRKILYYILSILLFLSSSSNAADIYSSKGIIFMNGPIKLGDYQHFLDSKYRDPNSDIVVLNSPGGSAYEGMKIAEFIRFQGMNTVVLDNSICYSICAIIWSAGVTRYASLLYSDIGFHAVYDPRNYNEKGSANAVLGAMLASFGYSRDAIYFMTDASPHNLNKLTPNKATQLGIYYTELGASQNSPTTNNSYAGLSSYDVVQGFYYALSIADGDLAAAYVIPEKRGKGPFNQSNIYTFYSSLRKPLSVQNITQVNGNQFRVDYHYIANKSQCNASAIVTTTNRYGYIFIESIKAKC